MMPETKVFLFNSTVVGASYLVSSSGGRMWLLSLSFGNGGGFSSGTPVAHSFKRRMKRGH